MASGFEHLAQLHVQTFDRIGSVNYLSDFVGVSEKGDDLVPNSAPALSDGRDPFSQGPRSKSSSRLAASSAVSRSTAKTLQKRPPKNSKTRLYECPASYRPAHRWCLKLCPLQIPCSICSLHARISGGLLYFSRKKGEKHTIHVSEDLSFRKKLITS
jgi:hypothetical protein